MRNNDTLRRFTLTAFAGLATFLIMLVGGAWLGLWSPYDNLPPPIAPHGTSTSPLNTFKVGQ